jgi:hypothetical protein
MLTTYGENPIRAKCNKCGNECDDILEPDFSLNCKCGWKMEDNSFILL